MKITELKERIKFTLPEVFISTFNVPTAKDGNVICPYCHNGTGEDGTGVIFNLMEDGYRAYCHKHHDKSFDYIDLLAHLWNLDNSRDFISILTRAGRQLGFSVDNFEFKQETVDNENLPLLPASHLKYKPKVINSRKNLKSFIDSHGGSYRGLPFEQFNKFVCGVDNPDMFSKYLHIVFPTSFEHISTRVAVDAKSLPDVDPVEFKKETKKHFGKKDLFGLPFVKDTAPGLPIFVVEGEFDAMSVDWLGFNALAVSGSKLSKRQLLQLATLPERSCIILMLDDDSAGVDQINANIKAIRALKDSNGSPKNFFVFAASLNIPGSKDANDALQADKQLLENRLNAIVNQVRELYSEFCKKIDRIQECAAGVTTKKLMPSCPVDVAIPEGFFISEDGVFAFDKDGELQLVTSDPVVVSKKFISHDYTDGQLELMIYDRRRKFWHSHLFFEQDIANPRAINKLSGMGLTIAQGRGKLLSIYLFDMLGAKENLERIQQFQFYNQTGWLDDSCEEFIYPEPLTEQFANIRNSGFDYLSAFKSKGDSKAFLDTLLKILKKSYVARTVVGAVLSAPLILPCKTRNIQVHVNAPSGNGKSAICSLAMAIWGDPARLKHVFHGTGNALDNIGKKFNDCPIWIDEYQSASKAVRENQETNLYNFELGKTKARLNKNAEDKPVADYRAVKITTAEQPLTGIATGQGAINRVIELNELHILEDKDAVKIHRLVKNNFGHFGKSYTDFLATDRNVDKAKRLNELFEDRYSNYNISPSHKQMWALIHTGLISFLYSINASEETIREFNELVMKDFDRFVDNSPAKDAATNASRALNIIAEEINSNPSAFFRESQPHVFSSIGYSDKEGAFFLNGNFAFFPNKLRELLVNKGFPDANPIINSWSEKNLFKFSESAKADRFGHRFQKSVRLDNKSTYMYVFDKDVFESLLFRQTDSAEAGTAE